MADMNVRDWHIDAALSNFSRGYRNSGYIADTLFPVIPVKNESDKYYIWGIEAYRRILALRADKTVSKEVGFGLTSATYSCEEYALKAKLSDRERANQDNQMDLERRKVENVTDLILLDREMRAFSLASATGTFANSTPSPKWNAGTSEDPIKDILTARDVFRAAAYGRYPNTIVLPPAVLSALQKSAVLRTALGYTEFGIITLEMLRRVFLIDNVLVPLAMYNDAAEGAADDMDDIWETTVGLYYVAPSVGLETQTMGMTFRQRDLQVGTWREPSTACDIYEPSLIEDVKVVDATCGYLLTAVIS